MADVVGILAGLGATASAETTGLGRPKNLAEAASQFEALLVAQMLRSMRESSEGGWLGGGGDPSGSALTEMAEEHLAKAITSNGGLGLAKVIRDQLAKGPAQAKD
jgi:Rod binding domain-containing protein